MKFIYLLIIFIIEILFFSLFNQKYYLVLFITLNFSIYGFLICLIYNRDVFISKTILYLYFVLYLLILYVSYLNTFIQNINETIAAIVFCLFYLISIYIYNKILVLLGIKLPKNFIVRFYYLGIWFGLDFYTGFFRLFFKNKPQFVKCE
jgi:hypothetical protein